MNRCVSGKALLLSAIALLAMLVFFGCASTWEYKPSAGFAPEKADAAVCGGCHPREAETYGLTLHSSAQNTAQWGSPGCGACHGGIAGHPESAGSIKPVSIDNVSKEEQNRICGSCHFDQSKMGDKAINPYASHGLFMDGGFAGEDRTIISCLGCHKGHTERKEMLKTLEAHVCFSCHKEAIVTMGVFQPVNYAAMGRICLACHPPHGASKTHQALRMTGGMVFVCATCHVP